MTWESLESGDPLSFYRVSQSIWKGIVTEPKTAKSKAPVPIIGLLARRLEEHRTRCGYPTSGAMFINTVGKPLDLNELYRRIIKDIFAAARIPWHGWHAFRRGLATNLHRLGVDDKTIQAILRHTHCIGSVWAPTEFGLVAELRGLHRNRSRRFRHPENGEAPRGRLVCARGSRCTVSGSLDR